MLFSDVTFLYFFMPAVILAVFLVPSRMQNAVILAASFCFYAWGEPVYWVLMAAMILFGYAAGLFLAYFAEDRRKQTAVLAISAGISTGVLVFFKCSGTIAFPIGISFYTFQTISYLADVYRNHSCVQKKIASYAMYIAMFPQLIAGPIVRYEQIRPQISDRKISFSGVAYGARRFTTGLAKKVILADTLALLVEQAGVQADVLGYFLAALGFMLQIYYDFSGYSDMAIGLGSMMGFTLPENFNYPYTATSITQFWRRWHMTLGSWFRDYVYIPLGGNRVGKLRWVCNLLIVWMLTGFWHGAAVNYILWGLYFCILLIVEKSFKKTSFCGKIPSAVRKAAGFASTFFLVMAGFLLFRPERVPLKEVQEIMTGTSFYYLQNYFGILLVSLVFMTPVAGMIEKRWRNLTLYRALRVVVCIVLLVLSTAYVIDSSFHPFLYFRF